MPLYYFFGLLVIPFTRSFYEQHLFGLEIPSLNQLLIILFIRSLLFFIAVLPTLMAWQGSRRSLLWRLGLALFYLVGFQSLIMANWMPWSLRLPHMIEILVRLPAGSPLRQAWAEGWRWARPPGTWAQT